MNRAGSIALIVGYLAASVASFTLIIEGRPMAGGVWLCAAALIAILERQS